VDTSKTYIKMCDCPEIQGQWNPKNFTSYHAYHKRLKRVGDFIYGIQWENSDREELIWLPRQDQIQKEFVNIRGIGSKGYTLVKYFCEWLISDSTDVMYDLSSMEQIWLAFYMHEKHKKIWDGTKWKKK